MNIEDKIRLYAKQQGIIPEAYPQFREGILKGLKVLHLRTDRIEERKYAMIANRKDTKEVIQWKQKNESANPTRQKSKSQ